jgi:hypothetical protein
MKRGIKRISYKPAEDILLSLDSYDDIFSGFDPRPYSQKSLSKDLLFECQKVAVDKPKKVHLKLLLERKKRNIREEIQITKRMRDHFNQHFLEEKKEFVKIRVDGWIWFALGCFLTVLTALLMEQETSLFVRVLVNVAHPGGWFFLWEGLAKVIIHSKEKRNSYTFNKKLKEAKISFLSK